MDAAVQSHVPAPPPHAAAGRYPDLDMYDYIVGEEDHCESWVRILQELVDDPERIPRCVGMHLARMEVTITLQEWLRRIPEFRLAPDARPQFHAGLIAGISNVPLAWATEAK